jgi:NADPH:quinone reductase-like Zn-dependent oxidoreductase
VPARKVINLPNDMSVTNAATLATTWLTAYRMLFTESGLKQPLSVRARPAACRSRSSNSAGQPI